MFVFDIFQSTALLSGRSIFHRLSILPALIPEREQEAAWRPVKTADGRFISLPYVKGRHRAEHVRQVRAWLARFRRTAPYPATAPAWLCQPRQLALTFR